jgi:uncharacterized protein YjiS (DUF1127 family)
MREAALFVAGQRGSADAGILSAFVRSAGQALRSFKNRRKIVALSEFDDHLLADIGLSRDDVRRALDLPFAHDPALELQRLALRQRRRGWNI